MPTAFFGAVGEISSKCLPARLVEEGCLVCSMPSAACKAPLSTWMVLGRARGTAGVRRARGVPARRSSVPCFTTSMCINSDLSSTLPCNNDAFCVDSGKP